MRAVIQRVKKASVEVKGCVTGAIEKGLLVFIGIHKEDSDIDIQWLCSKIAQLRIFEDKDGRMNQSVMDIKGSILLISQFTLYGNVKKGTRPSFNNAAPPELAISLYKKFSEELESVLGKSVPQGIFAANMNIEAHNDGPVTIILDSKNKGN